MSASTMMQVRLPANVQAGQIIMVQTPYGMSRVMVPENAIPGSILQIQVQQPPHASGTNVRPSMETEMTNMSSSGGKSTTLKLQDRQTVDNRRAQPKKLSTSTKTIRNVNHSSILPAEDGHMHTWTCCTARHIEKQNDLSLMCFLNCCICPAVPCGFCPCCASTITFINQDEMAIIAGFEKFKRIGKPGIQLLSRPCLVPHEKIVGRLSTRMQMVSLNDSTKTKDDAFVDYEATIIFEMINADDSAVYAAFYSLENADIKLWLTSCVKSILRAAISKLLLDEVFLSHNNLQSTIIDSIVKGDMSVGRHPLEHYGYRIQSALLTDCRPTKKIRDEMNNIYIQACKKQVQLQLSEAQKTMDGM